jgi:hypothetical protein
MTEATDHEIYKRRKLHRLQYSEPMFLQMGHQILKLSDFLTQAASLGHNRLIVCGSLEEMSREYVEEPLSAGWEFARKYIHKYRSPVYRRPLGGVEQPHTEISVKLASESWFPGCESAKDGYNAWGALKAEWSRTGLPLMSTPATTGMALLWETLPFGDGAQALPGDLARHIRRISPQHRKEKILPYVKYRPDENPSGVDGELWCYDGRFMYAAMARRDRFPVGAPVKVGGFKEYQPGFYDVLLKIPEDWDHVGLIPVPDYDRAEKFGTLGWEYPNFPGEKVGPVWIAEPELTFALKNGWHLLEVYDGWAFDKGRPLDIWAKRLIEMRGRLNEVVDSYGATPDTRSAYRFAAAAVREILTNTIGRLHKNTVEREAIVFPGEWRELIRTWSYAEVRTLEKYGSGERRIEYPEPNPSDFMIFMPHWSATLYSLARVEVLKYALKINLDSLIEIDGDAIYTSERQQWIEDEDKQKIGQLRRKES